MFLQDIDKNRGEEQRRMIGKIINHGSDRPDLESWLFHELFTTNNVAYFLKALGSLYEKCEFMQLEYQQQPKEKAKKPDKMPCSFMNLQDPGD